MTLKKLATSLWVWLIIAAVIAFIAFMQFQRKEAQDSRMSMQTIEVPKSLYAAATTGKVAIAGGLIKISANSTGTFKEVLVKEGDQVTMGQILAVQESKNQLIRIRSAEIALEKSQISLRQNELSLATRQRDLDRAKIQREGDAISQQALESQMDRLTNAELSLRSIRIDMERLQTTLKKEQFGLEQRSIRAPVDGRIIEASISPGAGASKENVSTLFTLMPDAERIIDVGLDDIALQNVFVGQKVVIARTNDRATTYPGKVKRIAEVFKKNKNEVSVIISAGDLPLRIGQPVLVRFLKSEEQMKQPAKINARPRPQSPDYSKVRPHWK